MCDCRPSWNVLGTDGRLQRDLPWLEILYLCSRGAFFGELLLTILQHGGREKESCAWVPNEKREAHKGVIRWW